jgi:hypothetical protein
LQLVALALVLLASLIGALAWWKYRREVVRLLTAILAELRRRD